MSGFPVRYFRVAWISLVIMCCCWQSAAIASDAQLFPIRNDAVFVFGGRVVAGDLAESGNPFTAPYEDHYVVGLGYQHFLRHWRAFSFGAEAGLAARFSGNVSGEVWGGPVVRYDGFTLFDRVRISPAMTFGFSAVTNTMTGRERNSEEKRDGNAAFLFYLGPEFDVSLVDHPNTEVFWRVHHRSGAWGALGDMHGAANAISLGVRHFF